MSDQRETLTQDDKTWALVAHIGTLVSAYVALGVLAPLLVMLVKGDSAFARRHAVESLNFQISLLIYTFVGGILAVLLVIVTLGVGMIALVPLGLLLGAVVVVLIIVATVRASNGELYEYPLTIRFIK